ncbi:MAG: hypothetical protein FWD82_05275 [Defluviitaleaceae bacterium]|nr:hypothetical protein [Defluviitaleaceae bacterium]
MKSLNELLNPYRTISIIGMGKNVGKTTTLNHLIAEFSKQNLRLLLTSIGRDGESTDVVTKTSKPQIFVPAGTIIITTEKLLNLCDITIEILMVTSITTPLGRVVVVRSLSDGFVQLGGPSITAQITNLLDNLKDINVDKIIVDGAISRKSLSNPALADCTILCSGAAVSSNIDEVIAKTQHEVEMLSLPCAKEVRSDDIHIQGAISDTKMREFIMSGENISDRQIIIEDASKIFITPETYEKLLIKQAKLFVKTPINLALVTINPISPKGFTFDLQEFLTKMQKAINVPVYDVLQGGKPCQC